MSSTIKNRYIAFIYLRLTYFILFWYTLSLIITYFRKRAPLNRYNNIKELFDVIVDGSLYKSTKYLFLSHPEHIQYNIDYNKFIGDCDNHSLYWCASIKNSNLAKKAWLCIYHMKKSHNNDFFGHSVCVYQDFEDQYYYFDYRYPEKIECMHDWLYKSSKSFAAKPICGLMFEIELFNNVFPKIKKITKIIPSQETSTSND